MRIACLGWWDGPNFGDDLAIATLHFWLEDHLGAFEWTPITQLHAHSATPGMKTVTDVYQLVKTGFKLEEMYDVLIIGPGGLFPWVQNNTFPRNVWGNIPIFLVGVGWAPHKQPEIEEQLQQETVEFLNGLQVQWGWARDCVMKSIMERSDVLGVLAPDIVYGADIKPGEVDPKRIAICPNATTGDAEFAFFHSLISSLLDMSFTPVLLPSSGVRGQMDAFSCYVLQRPGVEFTKHTPNYHEFIEELSSCACTYSMRKHPAIVAQLMNQGVWARDVMRSFNWMQKVANGYATVVLDGTEDAPTPSDLLSKVPANWPQTCVANRQRVQSALDQLFECLVEV